MHSPHFLSLQPDVRWEHYCHHLSNMFHQCTKNIDLAPQFPKSPHRGRPTPSHTLDPPWCPIHFLTTLKLLYCNDYTFSAVELVLILLHNAQKPIFSTHISKKSPPCEGDTPSHTFPLGVQYIAFRPTPYFLPHHPLRGSESITSPT